jgi:hypothetical protein
MAVVVIDVRHHPVGIEPYGVLAQVDRLRGLEE